MSLTLVKQEDWFELALQAAPALEFAAPAKRIVAWTASEEAIDDDFDDDFEEELDDDYEIEPDDSEMFPADDDDEELDLDPLDDA